MGTVIGYSSDSATAGLVYELREARFIPGAGGAAETAVLRSYSDKFIAKVIVCCMSSFHNFQRSVKLFQAQYFL